MSITDIVLDTDSGWLFPIVLSLNLINNYIAGWLINAGFSRFGEIGVFFIPISVLIVLSIDLLWGMSTVESLNFLNVSLTGIWPIASLGSTFVIIGLGLLLIRMVTKNFIIDLD